jgi:hypothetical protein
MLRNLLRRGIALQLESIRLQYLRQRIGIEAKKEGLTANPTQRPPAARTAKGFGTIQSAFIRVGENQKA